MACIGTWSFSLQAVEVAVKRIKRGDSCINALEAGINVVEDDPSTGPYYVGRGCYPNRNGIVQLDAAIMAGVDCSFGGVAGLEMYSKPISVAKKVLEHPTVNMLVGSGAKDFAADNGFVLEENSKLLPYEPSPVSTHNSCIERLAEGHDTLCVLCLDKSGHIAAGVSTSGPPFKFPGRVGDSPLPGCGLYADNTAGAAAATGNGEKIMRLCPSFHVVELIRQGNTPQQACEVVVNKIVKYCGENTEVALIALDMKGNQGTASTVSHWKDFREQKVYHGFPFTSWKVGRPIALEVQLPK